MPLALTGSLTAVQFCYPAELPLILNKLKCFETGSFNLMISSSYFMCARIIFEVF